MGKGDREALTVVVAGLQKELGKKSTFEGAVNSLTILFRDVYHAATEAEQFAMFSAASRASTLLQTRYTSPGFWSLGLKLFEQAQAVIIRPDEKRRMQASVAKAREFLGELNEREEVPPHMRPGTSSGFLFEGQLTVGPEPPRPPWLVAQTAIQDVLRANAERLFAPDADRNDPSIEQEINRRLEDILSNARTGLGGHALAEQFIGLEDAINATLQEIGSIPRGPPPASKEEVAKLPIISVTNEVLLRIGDATECAVCREVLSVGDKMQEMPCKHSFHPACLKPWLDTHNSCPICRYELRTDDLEYELQKERDKEAEEERRGYENTVRGSEYMYT